MSVKLADPRLFWEAKVLTLQRVLYIQTCTGADTYYTYKDNRWFDPQHDHGDFWQ